MDMPYRRLVTTRGHAPMTAEQSPRVLMSLPEFTGWSQAQHRKAGVAAAYASERMARHAATHASPDPRVDLACLAEAYRWADRGYSHWVASGNTRQGYLDLRDTIRRQFDTL